MAIAGQRACGFDQRARASKAAATSTGLTPQW
jgi:hypothetical protein